MFTYLCSEIGESRDVYRFDIEQNDLDEATTRYCLFKGNKTAYAKAMGNDDPRCKIVPIDQFDPDSHWSVDRWWSSEEKIALGIEDKKSSMDALEFSTLVSDVAETLGGFSAMLKDLSEKKNLIHDIGIKEISLNDNNLFNLFIGKRITKTELQQIQGDIPIFSANVFKPIGFHTKSNIAEFNNCSVLWGIDGDFEFRAMQKHTPFVTTDHCGTIEILSEQILPEYLALILEQAKHLYGFDRGLRSSLKNMKSITVKIPILQNGGFDLEYQKSVVEKQNLIKEIRQTIESYKEQLQTLDVLIDAEF